MRIPQFNASNVNASDVNASSAAPSRVDGATGAGSGDLSRLVLAIRESWRRGARPWLGVALGTVAIGIYVILGNRHIGPTVWRWGDVYASLPLITELRRMPLSFFLPTPYLPIWAAVGQIVLVVGIGEMVLGRWLVVWAGLMGHMASTLATRFVLQLDQGSLLALPHVLVHALDTGPSAAVTAVGACILVGLRLHRLALALVASLLIAALVAPGIDGLEHMVALTCGAGAGLSYLRLHRRTRPKIGPPRGVRVRSGIPSASIAGDP